MTDRLAEPVAAALADAGCTVLFGMPGGGNNLDLIDAAERRGIPFVLAHTEFAAAVMAAVHADATSRPCGCVVTRGPGAAASANGVAQALLDRQPVLLLSDAVSSDERERVSHQRLDQRALFAGLAKWTTALGPDPAATVAEAVRISLAPPRGPVHLDCDTQAAPASPPREVPVAEDADAALAEAARRLRESRRPCVLLGLECLGAVAEIRELLQGSEVPVLTTYRARGVVPDSCPNFAGLLTGAPADGDLLSEADLILALGLDPVELIPNAWPYPAPVVSLTAAHPDATYLGTDVEVVGPLTDTVPRLPRPGETNWPTGYGRRRVRALAERLLSEGGPFSPQAVVRRVRRRFPDGSIACVDAGAHMLPAMALWSVTEPNEVFISTGLATMGFALPAAIAASLAHPARRVACLVGDGGLGMVASELETLRRLRLPVTVVVFNDSALTLIAVKRPPGTANPNSTSYEQVDYAGVARGFGVPGHVVDDAATLDARLAESLAGVGPTLLDVRVDPSHYPHVLRTVRG